MRTGNRVTRCATMLALCLVSTSGVLLLARPAALQDRPAAQTPAAAELPEGMERYFVVLLRRGPAWTSAATPEARAVSQGHMDNIQRLTRAGTMVVAGPFMEQSGERALAGLFILRARSLDHAREITESDPAVRAGRFVVEILPWLGPKTLRHE